MTPKQLKQKDNKLLMNEEKAGAPAEFGESLESSEQTAGLYRSQINLINNEISKQAKQ